LKRKKEAKDFRKYIFVVRGENFYYPDKEIEYYKQVGSINWKVQLLVLVRGKASEEFFDILLVGPRLLVPRMKETLETFWDMAMHRYY
jgi:hypothetical protein|tara:strand:+ start:623 stop:886 length:264 start_codon:yes stop_codon:yes gene_type:complete